MLTTYENKTTVTSAFVSQYLQLRAKEQRLYNDEQVLRLPNTNSKDPHHKEWECRKKMARRLMNHFSVNKQASVLEIGSGNGWLCGQLSEIMKGKITGLEINSFEHEQATRLFGSNPNTVFFQGDINQQEYKFLKADRIIFAASIQYFPSLKEIINTSLTHLHPGGEIHIIDTHFYQPEELPAARERSRQYFKLLGFPGMIDYYFHHKLSDLNYFDYSVLHDPHKFLHRLKHDHPFYWIVVREGSNKNTPT